VAPSGGPARGGSEPCLGSGRGLRRRPDPGPVQLHGRRHHGRPVPPADRRQRGHNGEGGTILSQVEETYDGDGDITSDAQSHDGAVDDDTPSVDYSYQDTAGGQDRQTSITYPDGRKIALSYGASGSLTDAEGWVYQIADTNFSDGVVVTSGGSQTLAQYSYMGDGTMVGQSRPQTGANESITLDNFGDIADLNWTNSAAASTDHYGYGYDADGNVMYKENYVLTADSELYHANGASGGYDGLNRLTTFARGTLSTSSGGVMLDTISSPSTTQSWDLDALGNQLSVTTNGTTQTKDQNGQNQTTSVTTGGTTNDLTYDANGATTTDEDGRHWTYDAWGDPVTVTNSSGTLIETDAFDALGRRISVTTYSGGTPTTTDLYYSTAGQVIEEDKAGSVVSQTVYSVGYVNSIIEIDQATGSPGTLNQRLYVQQDANYNVTSVTDTSGNVLERYIYSPYGQQTVLNPDGSVKGDGTPASSSYNLPVGFQGMLFDPVLSDNLTPNRVYDPMLGTWTSEDPAGYADGANVYQSFGDAPSEANDALGLWSCDGTWTMEKATATAGRGDTIKELAAALLGHEVDGATLREMGYSDVTEGQTINVVPLLKALEAELRANVVGAVKSFNGVFSGSGQNHMGLDAADVNSFFTAPTTGPSTSPATAPATQPARRETDCQGSVFLIYKRAVIQTYGAQTFDALSASSRVGLPPCSSVPLDKTLRENGLHAGDWVQFANDGRYHAKHKLGAFHTENAIYVGGGLFFGLGLPDNGHGISFGTEAQIDQELVRQFNNPGSNKETITALGPEAGLTSPAFINVPKLALSVFNRRWPD